MITVLTFTICQDDKLIIPTHAGSMLRGAFGIALRRLSCLTELPNCQHCPFNTGCAYTQIFENTNDNGTNPYVLRLPKAQTILPSHTWQFGMTLIGMASEHYELVIRAWQDALMIGIGGGTHRVSAKIVKVMNMGQTIFEKNHFIITTPRALKTITTPSIDSPTNFTLHFITPFRLQHQGKIAHQSHQFEPKHLLVNLYNRILRCQTNHDKDNDWQIGYADFGEFLSDIDKLSFENRVHPVNINRHSSRQGRKITLFGMIGDVIITGDGGVLARLLRLLWLGQYVHVGKSTTLGLGQYQLQIRHH